MNDSKEIEALRLANDLADKFRDLLEKALDDKEHVPFNNRTFTCSKCKREIPVIAGMVCDDLACPMFKHASC